MADVNKMEGMKAQVDTKNVKVEANVSEAGKLEKEKTETAKTEVKAEAVKEKEKAETAKTEDKKSEVKRMDDKVSEDKKDDSKVEKKEKKKNGIWGFIKNNISFIVAFFLPVIVLTAIFIGSDIHPFGDNIYLRSDCYHQYAPFYRELYRKLTEGGNLTYSWNIGMGVNFSAIYAYYLASPINIFMGFLAPGGNVLVTIDILIILKTGLCGFGMAYYLTKRFDKKSMMTVFAGLFYAMSSYMAAFSWNIMWLDCLALLPLVVLGIEKLVKEKKFALYTISLGVAIFSNYYIAIMMCIFAVLYFAVQLVSAEGKKNFKYLVERIWLFAKYSIIAGGIGAAMFIPALCALKYTASGEMNFPEEWSNYFSVLDMLSRSMMNVPVSIFKAHEPNLYCTVAVFMFVPLYCLSEKVNRTEKIGKLILIAIFLISFNMNIPNYIWHGFHFPNSLPCRESFIYIFILITMAYEAVIHIRDFTTKEIGGCFAGAIGLFLIIEKWYVNTSEYVFQIVYLSAIFLAAYFFITILYKNKRIGKYAALYLAAIACIGEVAVNSSENSSYSMTGYSYYFEDNDAITALLDSIDEDDFYRVEKDNRRTKNDAAWNNYHGVSVFSSTASSYFTDYLGFLGFEKSTNAYSFYGSTPFSASLLSVKYIISDDVSVADKYYAEVLKTEQTRRFDNRYLMKLNYTLPLGFMVPNNFDTIWDMTGNNPFAVQNSFAETATGISNMFTQLNASSVDKLSYIDVNEDSDVYFYCTAYVEDVEYVVDHPEEGNIYNGKRTGMKHRQIVHVGEVPAGCTITVSTTDGDASSLQLYAYSLNKKVFENVMTDMADEGLEISEYDDNYIKGSIVAKNSGLMYTSIIYDRGWSAYVDGEEVEIDSINDALLAIPVPEGEHTIELKYTPDGFVQGWFITVASIMILLCCILYDRNKNKIIKKMQDDKEKEQQKKIGEDVSKIMDSDSKREEK